MQIIKAIRVHVSRCCFCRHDKANFKRFNLYKCSTLGVDRKRHLLAAPVTAIIMQVAGCFSKPCVK